MYGLTHDVNVFYFWFDKIDLTVTMLNIRICRTRTLPVGGTGGLIILLMHNQLLGK